MALSNHLAQEWQMAIMWTDCRRYIVQYIRLKNA